MFYCILKHGYNSDPKRPSFAQIIFPEKNGNGNVHEINLFSRFESLVKDLRQEPPLKWRDIPQVES